MFVWHTEKYQIPTLKNNYVAHLKNMHVWKIIDKLWKIIEKSSTNYQKIGKIAENHRKIMKIEKTLTKQSKQY